MRVLSASCFRGTHVPLRPLIIASLLVVVRPEIGINRAWVLAAGDVIAGEAGTLTPYRLAFPQQRIPRQLPQQASALEGTIRDASGSAVGGAIVSLRGLVTGKSQQGISNSEGVFRIIDLPAARYELNVSKEGYEAYSEEEVQFGAGEVILREIKLKPLPSAIAAPPDFPRLPQINPPVPSPSEKQAQPSVSSGLIQRQKQAPTAATTSSPEVLPRAEQVFQTEPDRWMIVMPNWDRYGTGGEQPYVKGHWWDPFDRNKLKGDIPIFGQRTFFNMTVASDTFFDGRRLPVPSNISAARPGSSDFFGRGEQAFFDQTFLFSFDLFRGDTSFRPVDWRIRLTPVVSLNNLDVRELGIVNIDVRRGTTRLDSHVGLQEAFVEVKLHDLSPNYDFISVRAGIQEFNSDFRGFLFVEEQPGVRVFGNLDSNRWQYNGAYFNFLEKDTNSGLNSFESRHQQVVIANVYRQDFFWPGYTAQFSVHYNKDDASIHFDKNGFLVRPAPVGLVVSDGIIRSHNIRAAYLGWTGDGHIGRLNLSHAFYQALGRDDFNTIAGRPVTINAQMAALELSVDENWARLKGSVFYASGSADPRGGRARGFDAIDDFPEFAGGIFSLWNREGIRLTGSGITLTPPNSLLPSLRSSKEEGQANFVNPGILLVNLGMNSDVTPKLRSFINVNYLRFERTEPLELVLFQSPIHHPIGVDSSIGVRYRPPLTENIILTAGAAALIPGRGFKDIYTGKTLFSVFADLRFQF
jgi:hypothetical protein